MLKKNACVITYGQCVPKPSKTGEKNIIISRQQENILNKSIDWHQQTVKPF